MDDGEECDDSGESPTCNDDCTTAVCGDGKLNTSANEQCDDGGASDTCNADCTMATCGDGNVDDGEECDDGGESASCDVDCTVASCGDGVFNATAGEECDGGGRTAACNADCTNASCGDGVVNMTAGEQCDAAGESVACDTDCTPAACGDGVVNMAAGESCDDLGESLSCDANCTAAICGDSTVNMTAGEQCDDGGESAACDVDCTPAVCGDGAVNTMAGESCDDAGESAVCDANCTPATCGDSTVNMTAGEQCDTGGESVACDADCTPAACGDGVVNMTAGEQCDDGMPPADGDGCDAMCQTEGCNAVDLLFVVDNSGSMVEEQARLLAAFPGFIASIEASLGPMVDSYHMGVITSDDYSGNAPGCTTIGDLVTQTSGPGSSNAICTPFAEGHRFATEMDDLVAEFACMAQVGNGGSPIEQPVTATIAALDPAKAVPGGCNENFLRDDAILVVVIVTDDPPYDFDVDDAHPTTDTSGWYNAVVAAKNGDPEAMVVVGIVPWVDVGCVFGGESPNLIGFVQDFNAQGVLGSVCEPDYGPILAQAVPTIATTCENFEPPP